MARLLTCDNIWDLLSAYADDEVSPDEASVVERHVAECAACACDLNFMRQTVHLLADTPQIAPPPGLREAIYACTILRPARRSFWQIAVEPLLQPARARSFSLAGAAMASVALLVVFGIHSIPPGNSHGSSTVGRTIASNEVKSGALTNGSVVSPTQPTLSTSRISVASANTANALPRTSAPAFSIGMLSTNARHGVITGATRRAGTSQHPDLTTTPTGTPDVADAVKLPIPVAPLIAKNPDEPAVKVAETPLAPDTGYVRTIRIEASAPMDTKALSSLASIKDDYSIRRMSSSSGGDNHRELKVEVMHASF